MQLGFWEYLLRKCYCKICLCWDCQLSGPVSRRMCKVTRMVLAMHQSSFFWCAVPSWATDDVPIEFTGMKVQKKFEVGVQRSL